MLRALLAFRDTVFSALRSLLSHPLRSVLTLLGIVIGVATVIGMTALTEGLRLRINQDLAQLGSNVFQLQKQPAGISFGPRDRRKYEKRKNLTLEHVKALRENCALCVRVGGEAWEPAQKIATNERSTRPSFWITGGTEEFFDNNGYRPGRGRFFTAAEAEGGADVVVVGADVVDALFPADAIADPLGHEVRIRGHFYRIVGVIERQGAALGGGSRDSLAAMPLPSFLQLYGGDKSLNITVQATTAEAVNRTRDQAVAVLRRARGVPPEAEDDFDVFSNESMQEQFNQMAGLVTVAGVAITLLALIVGGIGVMNIMLVSVTERTQEIGVRRALGARRRRILGQFLVEAVTLSAVGGALGFLLGTLAAWLARFLGDLPASVPSWSVVLALATASVTGLVFGIYPAVRASRLDPVEAMRTE